MSRARALAALLPALGAVAGQPARPVTLPNRLTLVVKEDFGRPVVRVRLRFDLPPRPLGLAAFSLDTLEHSATGSYSRGAFYRALDHAGLKLVRSLGPGTLTWELTGPPQAFDTGLGLLADQVLRPQLDGAALERARLHLYREAQALGPVARALQRARFRLGTLEGPLADEGLLVQTGQGDVEAFLRETLRPERARLTVEGPVGESQARTAAFLAFGTWQPPEATARPVPAPAPPRLTLAPAATPFAWVGVDLSGSPRAFRTLLALAAPETVRPGVEFELHPHGFALRRSGPPLAGLAGLQEDLDAFARQGLSPEVLARAKRRHAAREATLGLHPALEAPEGLGAEVQAMEAGTFHELLRKAFESANRHAVLGGLGPKEAADPSFAAFGEPEVWVEGRSAFLRSSAAAEPGTGPRR
jgi:hypothetical protein